MVTNVTDAELVQELLNSSEVEQLRQDRQNRQHDRG